MPYVEQINGPNIPHQHIFLPKGTWETVHLDLEHGETVFAPSFRCATRPKRLISTFFSRMKYILPFNSIGALCHRGMQKLDPTLLLS